MDFALITFGNLVSKPHQMSTHSRSKRPDVSFNRWNYIIGFLWKIFLQKKLTNRRIQTPVKHLKCSTRSWVRLYHFCLNFSFTRSNAMFLTNSWRPTCNLYVLFHVGRNKLLNVTHTVSTLKSNRWLVITRGTNKHSSFNSNVYYYQSFY